jgi:hypothetical protein
VSEHARADTFDAIDGKFRKAGSLLSALIEGAVPDDDRHDGCGGVVVHLVVLGVDRGYRCCRCGQTWPAEDEDGPHGDIVPTLCVE